MAARGWGWTQERVNKWDKTGSSVLCWELSKGVAGAELTPCCLNTDISIQAEGSLWKSPNYQRREEVKPEYFSQDSPRQTLPMAADARKSQHSRGGLPESKQEDGLGCGQRFISESIFFAERGSSTACLIQNIPDAQLLTNVFAPLALDFKAKLTGLS